MARRLTPDDVRHVARLAHLELAPGEIEEFTGQLQRILEYAAEVQSIDTANVPPTTHALVRDTKWREDEAAGSVDRARALDIAPDKAVAAGLFRVPKVL